MHHVPRGDAAGRRFSADIAVAIYPRLVASGLNPSTVQGTVVADPCRLPPSNESGRGCAEPDH